ncbi:Mu-like prophage major head subunit gpT family protein [Bosea minatitlanensis]|uniref:Mu-like prophage major head subunit gpT family protein n=1 Tax=Bosea minatitlanensis TaxID=128782 RepID=A0ABW0F221_9HYPH|nr:Mu-like prophage major head subunit gpT family protein [Bosea minatitlanensis]MCT4491800.1 Mu-like prophage major head subunit gpT family protein [Bosea minatitlanensis]
MIINSSNLRMLTTGYRANFVAGLAAVTSMWARFATEVPSTTSEELYPFLNQIPGMRKWIGERQLKNVGTGDYRLVNEDWEDTVKVTRNAILDDRFGIFAPLMTMLGDAAARQPDELVFSTFARGFDTNCFDGQFFFDTDHPVLDADGSVTSVSNMQAGAGDPWYLLDLTKAVRPIIFQNRQKPTFAAMDNPDDESVFMRKEFVYGADSRNTAGFGFWQTAFGSKAPLDAANFKSAFDAMSLFKKDYGAPLAITPNVLLVGPSNRSAGETIVKKMNLAGGESNLDYGRVELVVAPWLG